MKKFLAIMLVVIMTVGMVFVFTSCSDGDDWKAIEDKGYFTCGITYYEPMNYFDDDGTLVGFDTEFAQAVAKKLGVEVKFQIINWESKYAELNAGTIDCIWNGFTIDDERKENVDFSKSYLNNSQCVVVKSANASQYTSVASFSGKKGVAEEGSAGAAIAEEFAGTATYTGVDAQTKALTEVNSGTADFAVIDVLMANAMVGKGDYSNLTTISNSITNIEPEEYGVGFRKGSNFTAKVNDAIKALIKDGTLATIAARYELTNALITE